MYAPLRFELDTELSMISPPLESNSSTTQIDVGKVFKGKTDKKYVLFSDIASFIQLCYIHCNIAYTHLGQILIIC